MSDEDVEEETGGRVSFEFLVNDDTVEDTGSRLLIDRPTFSKKTFFPSFFIFRFYIDPLSTKRNDSSRTMCFVRREQCPKLFRVIFDDKDGQRNSRKGYSLSLRASFKMRPRDA